MATIIVEDGTIVEGANSLNTVLEFQTYTTDRGITVVGDESTLLVQANDAMWAYDFKGSLVDIDQGTPFPRDNLLVHGYEVANNTIPLLAKKMQLELAIAIDQGYNPNTTQTRTIKRAQSASGASVEYQDGTPSYNVLTSVNTVAAPLLKTSSGFGHVNIKSSLDRLWCDDVY